MGMGPEIPPAFSPPIAPAPQSYIHLLNPNALPTGTFTFCTKFRAAPKCEMILSTEALTAIRRPGWGPGKGRSVKAPCLSLGKPQGTWRARFTQFDPERGGPKRGEVDSQTKGRKSGCPTFFLLLQLASPTLGFCHPQSLVPGDAGKRPGTTDWGKGRRTQ